jgi:hypothetical protein
MTGRIVGADLRVRPFRGAEKLHLNENGLKKWLKWQLKPK